MFQDKFPQGIEGHHTTKLDVFNPVFPGMDLLCLYSLLVSNRDPDRSNGLLRRSPIRSGNAGNGQGEVRRETLQYARGHFADGLFADGAKLIQGFFPNPQLACFYLVGIRNHGSGIITKEASSPAF